MLVWHGYALPFGEGARPGGVEGGTVILRVRHLCAALGTALLAGCATTIHNAPINRPLATPAVDTFESGSAPPPDNDEFLIGLAFSGGGMRAAAFSYGVLSEFDGTQIRSNRTEAPLSERIAFLSGVSGGAVTAAYFGLKGRAALSDFRERFLLRNAEESLATDFTPTNVFRAYEGGVNDAQHFPRWLDDNLFHGATFREFEGPHRPRVWINASDIYNRTPFVFNDATFATICSDLSSYPVASAVAASAAMPVVFAPVVLQTFPERCAAKMPDWIERAQTNPSAAPIIKEAAAAITRYRDGSVPFIKLLDGGLVDNYGLSGFTMARLSANTPYGPLLPQQAVKMRRVLFLVVDGGRGVSGDWARTADGPTGPEIVVAAADTAIDSSVRSSFTAFERSMSEWQQTLVRWRCGLSAGERGRYGAAARWDCRDLKFHVGRINFAQLGKQRANELSAVPTRFKMAPEEVDTVIAAGRDALRTSSTFQAFLANP